MQKIIKIKHSGNIGNKMFQYMFARALQARVANSTVIGFDIPEWGLVCNTDFDLPENHMTITGHNINIEYVANLLNSGTVDAVLCDVWAMRLEYYNNNDMIRSLFINKNTEVNGFGEDRIVINIRSSEIIRGLHKDYTPLQFSFYRYIIEVTGLAPVFMGQVDGRDPYCVALRKEFGSAEFVEKPSGILDFFRIMNSKNIVMSVSSFSWLACWFSSHSAKIHMPLSGIFNPRQRSDVNLIPVNDDRYNFYLFPQANWRGTDSEIAELINSNSNFLPLSKSETRRLVYENVKY